MKDTVDKLSQRKSIKVLPLLQFIETKVCILLLTFAVLLNSELYAQKIALENFEDSKDWSFIKSDGVNLNLSIEKGMTNNAIRFDYDFTKGTGYGGIQKLFPIDLPDNYEFTFYLKAESPSNNFEIKFIDKSGDNVWWVNNRNYEFPGEWQKITIKKRHISFAWGPTENKNLKRIDRIEFTIASFVGGKGTIWLDNLSFETLPQETTDYPSPLIVAESSLKNHPSKLMLDANISTFWKSHSNKTQNLLIDFKTRREIGGFHFQWLDTYQPDGIEILLSDDKKSWESAYKFDKLLSSVTFIRLAETQARYAKIILNSNKEKSLALKEMNILDVSESISKNDFLKYCAENSPKGYYPRYFLKEGSFWTITGVNNDSKEALINEDAMIEVEKGAFSLEPILKSGDSVYTWSNITSTQTIGTANNKEYTFEPTVIWQLGKFTVNTTATSVGEANKKSALNIRYSIKNNSSKDEEIEFFLLIRPFQVNPYYQWLNNPGGVGKINRIEEKTNHISVDDKILLFSDPYNSFSAFTSESGNPVDFIKKGIFPVQNKIADKNKMAGAILKYKITVSAGATKEFYFKVPYHQNTINPQLLNPKESTKEFEFEREFWNKKTSHTTFDLPASADKIINTYKSNLIYILVNRDYSGIQPGSRSYERSWIRDGALTSSALLKSGIVEEVKDFINWYSDYLFDNGKVPCVVDFRGPDPVPENDSHGQYIYLIREYFNFTKDTAFLKSKNASILKVVDYIEELINQRSTSYYKYGNDSLRAFYGLVPESISHEGYSAKAMHSYWDNFFIMKGLKDAAEIQKTLGNTTEYNRIASLRDTFKDNLYNSLQLAINNHKIDYVPGCVELGDFDATSTTVAISPCNELSNLPKPQIYNTFDKYYEFFKNRRDNKINWINYTPYENRIIGSFILLDQPQKAHELIDFFLQSQHPKGWYHWAEVVWKNDRHPEFIGDMPHTWVGSDFINSIRSMFVYENEYDQSLVLASALYQDWIDAPEGMSVQNLPTYYGDISFSILKSQEGYKINLWGKVQLPANGVKIKNFNQNLLPKQVTINGKTITGYSNSVISVTEIPAEINIKY